MSITSNIITSHLHHMTWRFRTNEHKREMTIVSHGDFFLDWPMYPVFRVLRNRSSALLSDAVENLALVVGMLFYFVAPPRTRLLLRLCVWFPETGRRRKKAITPTCRQRSYPWFVLFFLSRAVHVHVYSSAKRNAGIDQHECQAKTRLTSTQPGKQIYPHLKRFNELNETRQG